MADFMSWAKEHSLDPEIVARLEEEDLNEVDVLRDCSEKDLEDISLRPQQIQQVMAALRGNPFDEWAKANKIKPDTVAKIRSDRLDNLEKLKTVPENYLKGLQITTGQIKLLKRATDKVETRCEGAPAQVETSWNGATAQVQTSWNGATAQVETRSNVAFDQVEKRCYEGQLHHSFTPKFNTDREIRVVLIGKTGVGKSATGNTLLGRRHFESLVSATSVTNICKKGEAIRNGKRLLLVDTPGLFDTGLSNEEVSKEIIKCVGITSPGPHAIVLVCHIGRFTEEEQKTVEYFVDKFGKAVLKYMIVLFTRKDDLTKHGQTVEQYMSRVPKELNDLLQKCGNRYIAFNNDAKGRESEEQVDEFLHRVRIMVDENGGSAYTNEIYKEAEAELQQRMLAEKMKLHAEKEEEKRVIAEKIEKRFQKKLKAGKIEKDKLELEIKQKEEEMKKKLEAKEKEYKEKMEEDKLRQEERKKIEGGHPFLTMLKDVGSAVSRFFTGLVGGR